MNKPIAIATTKGIVLARRDGVGWQETGRGLEGISITSVAALDRRILAGTKKGVRLSEDGGQTWREANEGLTEPYVRWLAFHPDGSGRAFAGTEPAGIYISKDGGASWRECPEVAALRKKHRWSLPYSPGAGCVRGFAFNGERGYAAVEVGGALRSEDGGKTWALAEGSDGRPTFGEPRPSFVHPDVHSIAVHPGDRNRIYAPTGGGYYQSSDGGRTWASLYECYCRAVWTDADDPDHLVLGPADDVDSDGRIERSRDGGRTWEPASAGLNVPWGRHMVERFLQVEDGLLAVLSNGGLLSAPLESLEWTTPLPELKGVNAVAIG